MIVLIGGEKGGTGKTTLSTNLAAYMAESEPTVLADLDVEEPNSGLYIRGEVLEREVKFKEIPEWDSSRCELCGDCQTVCNFNAILKLGKQIMVFSELCHGCYACSELCPTGSLPMVKKKMGELKALKVRGLDFIESKLLIGEEQAVPLIKQTIDYVDRNYSKVVYKIYDSPPGTSCPVIEVTKNVDLVILITEPTPFGLHDLKLAVETVRHLGKDFAVVINRLGLGDDRVERYCEDEHIEIIASIPNDRKIAEIYSAGELLYPRVPEVKDAVKKIADFIRMHGKDSEK